MKMAFPPEAFIIGAMKAGTTSLASWLDQHPKVTLSRPKEAAYFTRNYEHGPGWYEERFNGPADSIFLDATPAYTAAPTRKFPKGPGSAPSRFEGVPERMHSLSPRARLIYLLRDPVHRTYSAYWHAVRQREEEKAFGEAIRNDSFYLRGSDYYGQIVNYLDFFPLTSFLFIKFEEMVADPQAAIETCLTFLGLDPTEGKGRARTPQLNRSFQYNVVGTALARSFSSNKNLKAFLNAAKSAMPSQLQPIAKRMISRDIPPIDSVDRRFLMETFRETNEQLEELTGISVASWQTNKNL